jgi:hypothetical protein
MGSAAANAPLAIEVLAVSKYDIMCVRQIQLVLITFTKALLWIGSERGGGYFLSVVLTVLRLR